MQPIRHGSKGKQIQGLNYFADTLFLEERYRC